MSYRTQVLALPNLEYYWPLGETSGSVATDYGPHATNGSYAGGVTLNQASGVPSTLDPSVSLDGVNGYVALPSTSVDFTNGFSFIVWCKPTAVANYQRLIDLAGAGAGGNLNMMFYRSVGSTAVTLDVFDSGGHAVFTSSTGALVTGVWQMLVGTVDASGNAVIYRNGAVFNTRTGMARPVAGTRTLNYLGKSNFGDPYYTGGLDDVAILSRALTAQEVADLYAAGIAALSSLPVVTVQVCWNPAFVVNWGGATGIWTQPYADLGAHECLFEVHVRARAGNPSLEDDTCTVVLDNKDGLYDPWNPASPVQPYLGVGRLVRVLTTQNGLTRCVFYGSITDYTVEPVPQAGRGYQLTLSIQSPLKAGLSRKATLPLFATPRPYDGGPGTGGSQSLLPFLFSGNTNYELDTSVVRDENGAMLGGGERTVGAWLTQIARSSGGIYFCRPLYRIRAADRDYEIVWLGARTPRTAAAAWAAVDTAGDIEAPAQAVYSVQGLAV